MPRHATRTAFKKGNPGRPKGIPNKFTTLKESFISAFKELGGEEFLKTYATKDQISKGRFLQMVAQMLPKDVTVSGNPDAPLQVQFNNIKGMIENATDSGKPKAEVPGVPTSVEGKT